MFHVKHALFCTWFCVLFSCLIHAQGNYSMTDKPFQHANPQRDSVWNVLASNKLYRQFSSEEQDFLYWLNILRKDPPLFAMNQVQSFLRQFPELAGPESRSLLQDLSSKESMDILIPDEVLIRTASEQAKDLASHAGTLTHYSSKGASFALRMNNAGIMNCAGENLYEGKNEPLTALLLLLIDKGVPGSGHRKSLLDPKYKKTGISIKYKSDGLMVILVQDLSCQ